MRFKTVRLGVGLQDDGHVTNSIAQPQSKTGYVGPLAAISLEDLKIGVDRFESQNLGRRKGAYEVADRFAVVRSHIDNETRWGKSASSEPITFQADAG